MTQEITLTATGINTEHCMIHSGTTHQNMTAPSRLQQTTSITR